MKLNITEADRVIWLKYQTLFLKQLSESFEHATERIMLWYKEIHSINNVIFMFTHYKEETFLEYLLWIICDKNVIIYLIDMYLKESQGSSVSIVSGYGLDDRTIEGRSLAEARGFFL
jgi:hypothetical protein